MPKAHKGRRARGSRRAGSRAGKSERSSILLAGWGYALGSRRVGVADVEREFSLASGRLHERAGIESVRRVATNEGECTLGACAAEAALKSACVSVAKLDWIVATSETHDALPSLAPVLHSRLGARPDCGATDVGGACAGLANAFLFAAGVIASGQAARVLVVTADVHSRLLTPANVAGTFGGLFGDGASAFVLCAESAARRGARWQLGPFVSGCEPEHMNAITVTRTAAGATVEFDGEALARAAVSRLSAIIAELESSSALSRHNALAFATHQPNPRLVELLARQLGVASEKFPPVARTCGNLGSSTCGVALAMALEQQAQLTATKRGPIFLAAIGPGLIWSGCVLTHARQLRQEQNV